MDTSLENQEKMWDARLAQGLASCLQDVRHGVILLWRDAYVSALIIGVLALGIGGNAAIFTLLKAAFLDPLPYRDGDRLVTIMENTGWIPTVSEFLEIRARNRTLEQIAFAEHRDMQVSGRGEPVRVIARLRQGVTYAQAQADARSIASVLTHAYPAAFPNPQHDPSLFTFLLLPLRDAIVGTQRALLWLLLGGVGVLLLIACANAAQLLLARSLRRRREIGVRCALGAAG